MIVHVGILLVNFPRNHCGALAFTSRLPMQREILQHVYSCCKIKDSQLQKKLTNRFG